MRRPLVCRRPLAHGVLAVLPLLLLGVRAAAEQAPGALHVAPEAAVAEGRRAPDPAGVPEVLRLPPAALAAAAELRALAGQAVVPGVPYRNGFSRSGRRERVTIGPAGSAAAGAGGAADGSTVVWTGRFVVEEAHAFRVRLRDVVLPEEARVWVHADAAWLGPFGRELLDPEGTMWLPPAPGPEAVVEVEVPALDGFALAAARFTIGEVMELVADPTEGSIEPQAWTDCDLDAACVSTATLSTIDLLREATARLSFVVGGSSFLCSGALLNDNDATGFRPYLLTAHHCFGSQEAASSLVAYFDYRPSACGGAAPSLADVPSVSGATLLATGSASDFTLVELSANPAGTTHYLGWTTAAPTGGSGMHRVSHPLGSTQRYSASSFTGGAGLVCGGLPTTDFHYSEGTAGATAGGSSGAPVTQTIGGQSLVVGQLLGVCRFETWDACTWSTYNLIDGAFSTTFPAIRFWINDLTGCADAHEPDNTPAQATPLLSGSPQQHGICPASDDDWFTFSLAEEAAVTLTTSGPAGDTRLTLFDAELTGIDYDDDGGPELFSSIDRECGVDALPAGTYFVHVDEFGDDDPIAEYQLAYTRGASCATSCPADLTLSHTTLTGSVTYRAAETITLGPALTIDGSDVQVLAGQRVAIGSGTAIGGSFAAGTGVGVCAF